MSTRTRVSLQDRREGTGGWLQHGKPEETVSSGSETKSGNKNDSDAKSRNATEATSNQPKPGGEPKPLGANKPQSVDAAPSSPSAEPSKAGAEGEPSLGRTLAAARERHGLSRADIVAETRIPAHYIEMIESSDYGLISDQLYLMPFLRRYAAFLNLDGEEVAMRFVREVQRAELAAVPPRMSEPLALHDRKRTPWGRVACRNNRALRDCRALHHRLRAPSRRIRLPSIVTSSRAHRAERCNAGSRRAGAHGRTSTMAAPPPMAAPAPMAARPYQWPRRRRRLPLRRSCPGPPSLAVRRRRPPKRLRKAPPSRASHPLTTTTNSWLRG